MSMKFTVGGAVVDADTLVAAAPKPKAKPKKEAPANFHRGFRVVGHAPRAMERARDGNAAEWAEWNSHGAAEREFALKKGRRPPPMWDEEKWRRQTKKTAVRTKPYEVAAAADECAEMARKAGWLDVQVDALAQGDPVAAGPF